MSIVTANSKKPEPAGALAISLLSLKGTFVLVFQGNSMFQSAEVVGWVELRETHHEYRELVGLVKLDPPYILKNCSALVGVYQR